MAPHSSILAVIIPCTEEPGGLQSMGSQWVRHDWACTHPINNPRQRDTACMYCRWIVLSERSWEKRMQFRKWKIWERDDGEGCTQMWVCLVPLNCTIRYSAKSMFYVMWLLSQLKKIFFKAVFTVWFPLYGIIKFITLNSRNYKSI